MRARAVPLMACLTLLARFWHASTALNRPVSPRTVVTPALHARAISRHDFPSARRAETKSRLKIAFGLPTALPLRVPCALARLNPALTRSELRLRSCLAIHAAIAIINSPAGPVVLKCSSVELTNWTRAK